LFTRPIYYKSTTIYYKSTTIYYKNHDASITKTTTIYYKNHDDLLQKHEDLLQKHEAECKRAVVGSERGSFCYYKSTKKKL